jgi:hypothetical protein
VHEPILVLPRSTEARRSAFTGWSASPLCQQLKA